MEDPVLFALAVAVILGTPGPTNTLLIVSGAMSGFARSLPLVAAEAVGYSISILAIGLVLEPLIARVPGLGDVLRIFIGCYLIVLSIRLWRGPRREAATGTAPSPVQIFVTTLLNPKAILFALQIMPFGSPLIWGYFLVFLLILVVVSVSWILAGAMAGQVAHKRGHFGLVPRTGAAAIAAFGLVMIITPLLR